MEHTTIYVITETVSGDNYKENMIMGAVSEEETAEMIVEFLNGGSSSYTYDWDSVKLMLPKN